MASNADAAKLRRAERYVWKGGSEANRNPLLKDCGLPPFLEVGNGCAVVDDTGRRYIDYLMGWGSVLLGHRHAAVDRAAQRQLQKGATLGLPPELEMRLAARVVDLVPGMDQVRFVASGSEATAAAVRIARAATQRVHVAHCGFHGWLDWCQGATHPDGIPTQISELTHAFRFNDIESLATLLDHRACAAVMLEPVSGALPEPEFLRDVKRLTRAHGAVLVFDEAKTGFRLGPGGAQEQFGVVPDLTILSKALGNGYPIAAIGGRSDVLAAAAGAWITGTFHGWPPAMAAALATLEVLQNEPIHDAVSRAGRQLQAGFDATMRDRGIRLRLGGAPAMPMIAAEDKQARRQRQSFVRALVARGYIVHPIRPWFVSAAHSEAVIKQTLTDVACAADEVAAA